MFLLEDLENSKMQVQEILSVVYRRISRKSRAHRETRFLPFRHRTATTYMLLARKLTTGPTFLASFPQVGISAAGGVGRATAELITQGLASHDFYELDVTRFLGLHNNRKFLRDRVKEVPGMHYALQYPHHEFKTGRNLRMSPIYPKLREAGAVFGQVMGYERPTWFQPENELGECAHGSKFIQVYRWECSCL